MNTQIFENAWFNPLLTRRLEFYYIEPIYDRSGTLLQEASSHNCRKRSQTQVELIFDSNPTSSKHVLFLSLVNKCIPLIHLAL